VPVVSQQHWQRRKRLAGCDSSYVSSAGVKFPVMTTAMADSVDWLGPGVFQMVQQLCAIVIVWNTVTIGASS